MPNEIDCTNDSYEIITGFPFRTMSKKELRKIKSVGVDKIATDISNRLLIQMNNYDHVELTEDNIKRQICDALEGLIIELDFPSRSINLK
jgi:hypothetical protein